MNDSEFDNFLRRESAVKPLAEAPFRRAVWERIEAESAKASWYEALLARLIRPTARPAAGAACVLLTILAGVWLGRVAPSPAADARATYLASITPAADHALLHHR